MHQHFNYEGSKIFYKKLGQGEPVFLIHGFAEDSSIWDLQLDAVKNNLLILIDLPGASSSEILLKDEVNIFDYAEIINEICVIENIKSAGFIGHSMGGYICLAFAELYPEKVNALGLIHSTAYEDSLEKIETRKKSMAFIQEHGSAVFVKTIFANLFYEPSKNETHIDTLITKGSQFLPSTLIQYYHAMINRPDRSTVLKNADYPVLFVIGEHDQLIPLIDSLRLSHIPQHGHIHILRKSGHMGMLEETQNFNKILAHFLLFK